MASELVADLKKLAELHKTGVLSDAEFTTAKNRALERAAGTTGVAATNSTLRSDDGVATQPMAEARLPGATVPPSRRTTAFAVGVTQRLRAWSGRHPRWAVVTSIGAVVLIASTVGVAVSLGDMSPRDPSTRDPGRSTLPAPSTSSEPRPPPPPDDANAWRAQITECTVDNQGFARVRGEVANDSSRLRSYQIQIVLEGGNNLRAGSGLTTANGIPPGGVGPFSFQTSVSSTAGAVLSCNIESVRPS